MATPPEETRNWAAADEVVPNAVPPEEAVSRPPPHDVDAWERPRRGLTLGLATGRPVFFCGAVARSIE
jgi:hypothetical protein